MNILLKLKQQRLDHQKSHVALTKLLAEIESLDLIHENNQLKTENDKLRESIKKSQAEISQVQQKNYKLKEALTEQIIDERLSIIKLSRKKMGTLFINSENSNQNRLSVIEKRYKKEIENYKKRVPDKYINENEIIFVYLRKSRLLLVKLKR
jgi:regulator of replication initiation timing